MVTLFKRAALTVSATAISTLVSASALAQFAGPTPEYGGASGAGDVESIRSKVLDIMSKVLSLLALLAVIIIIIAGIRLIASQGEETTKDKAKKTIFYAIIGLLIILFAGVIVSFFTTTDNFGG